jgi:Protein of unknown function (DUF3313)
MLAWCPARASSKATKANCMQSKTKSLLGSRRGVGLACLAGVFGVALSGCASAVLTESGRLSSYAGLKPSDGVMTKTRVHVDKNALLAAKTLRLMPAAVDGRAASSGLTEGQLQLVSNAIDRTLCRDLSRRFVIVMPDQPAELVVQAVVTNVAKTDTFAAGVSVAAGLSGKVASVATGIPAPVPRIPFGMGSLSVEAEVKDSSSRQLAAFVWARAADAMTTSARIGEEADAHTLAESFASDFATLLVTGSDPIANPAPLFPSAHVISAYFGAEPKYPACRAFGRDPGLGHTLGGVIGLPPSWTDKGGSAR